MNLNRKGMSIIEIIVSITLISIVLIFLMNLFVKVRTTYNQEKMNSDYEVIVSTITKAIGSDIENYGLRGIRKESNDLVLTFDTNRTNNYSELIRKRLRLYTNPENGDMVISYTYDNEGLTAAERKMAVTRKLPEGAIIGSNIEYSVSNNIIAKIRIPIKNNKSNVYNINMYGVCSQSGCNI